MPKSRSSSADLHIHEIVQFTNKMTPWIQNWHKPHENT